MKTGIRLIIFFFCLALFSAESNAQADSSTIQPGKKLSLKIGTFFNNNLNYYGRTDSIPTRCLFSMAELWLNNKFCVSVAPIFTHKSKQGFDYAGTATTVGYNYHNGKSAGHLYVSVPLYESSSNLVQSALRWQAAFNYTWVNQIVNITAGSDIKQSNNTDFGFSIGLDHLFKNEFCNGKLILFNPSVFVYSGTQQFTRSYYQKSNIPLLPANDKMMTERVRKITLLSYEFSMPVIYKFGKWMLVSTPAYVMPQHVIQADGKPVNKMGLFYLTTGFKFTL